MYIQFSDSKIVAFYSYRTARVFGVSIYCSKELYKEVKKILEVNGYNTDNHICWTTADGLSYMWSDGKLTIGTEIVVRNW